MINIIEAFSRGIQALTQSDLNLLFPDFYKVQSNFGTSLPNLTSKFLESYYWKVDLLNPDYFFALLQYGISVSFKNDSLLELKAFDKNQRLDFMLANSYSTLESLDFSADINLFTESCSRINVLSDSELIKVAKESFKVDYRDILNHPSGQIYTKLNHGFWEFFLNAYIGEDINENIQLLKIRDLRLTQRPSGSKRSGFYFAMKHFMSHAIQPLDSNDGLRFAIGLNAGDERYNHVINRPLKVVERGALKGALSFLMTIKSKGVVKFEDGAEPREMLKGEAFIKFIKRFVHQSDACLVIAPSHLAEIKFPYYSGSTHFLALPRKYIHEEWRSTLPVALGSILFLLEKHTRVTVLVQGANFATLLALALNSILDSRLKQKLDFFDLGRVLDITNFEICSKWPSFKGILGELDPNTSNYISIDSGSLNNKVVI